MPDGRHALVGDRGGTSVALLDLERRKVCCRLAGFHGPCGVAVSPDGAYALVANQQDGDIGRIDLKTRDVTFPILLEDFSMHHGIAIAPDGAYALVANSGRNNIGRIDLRTWEVGPQRRGGRLAEGVGQLAPGPAVRSWMAPERGRFGVAMLGSVAEIPAGAALMAVEVLVVEACVLSLSGPPMPTSGPSVGISLLAMQAAPLVAVKRS